MVPKGKDKWVHVKEILHYVKNEEYLDSVAQEEKNGLRKMAKNFIVEGDNVYYIGPRRDDDSLPVQKRQVLQSEEEVKKVLQETHDNIGHHGVVKTQDIITQAYYWSSITQDVILWVKNCPKCQFNKKVQKQRPGLHPVKVERTWEVLDVDLVGPLKVTTQNNCSKPSKKRPYRRRNLCFECGQCRTLYSSHEEASQCLLRHEVSAVWEELTPQEDHAHLEGSKDSAEAEYGGDHEDSNLWTPATLDLFLRIVRDHYPNLMRQGERRDVVWKDIHASITNHVPFVTLQQIKDKWMNVQHNFFKYEEAKKQTGAAQLDLPASYDLLCSFLMERPVVKSEIVVDCGIQQQATVDQGQPALVPLSPTSSCPAAPQSTSPCPASSFQAAPQPGGVAEKMLQHAASKQPVAPVALVIPDGGPHTMKRRRINPPSSSQRAEERHQELLGELRANRESMTGVMKAIQDFTVELRAFNERLLTLEEEKLKMLKANHVSQAQ